MRYLAFFLAFWTWLLSANSVLAADATLLVGFAESEITPDVHGDKPVWIAGYGHGRRATGVHDPLMVRCVVLGHLQRGGPPTTFDRVLATQFGTQAATMVGRGEFGRMVTVQGGVPGSVALAEVAGHNRTVPLNHPLLTSARQIGVCLG